MNKDIVEIFLTFGCIALMPLLMTLGIIAFPILVIINLKQYIDERL